MIFKVSIPTNHNLFNWSDVNETFPCTRKNFPAKAPFIVLVLKLGFYVCYCQFIIISVNDT